MITDDLWTRNNDRIRYPRTPDLCDVSFCPVYELAQGCLAAPLYSVLDMVSIVMQSLMSSTLHIALTLDD